MVQVGARGVVPGFDGLVGVATRDITPPVGIRARNWGPADWDAATGAHAPFVLTAIAFASDQDGPTAPLLMITLDGTWWRRVDDEQRLRNHVRDTLGLAPERLLISLSHTHAGAVLCSADADLPGGELITPYLRSLAEAAADAGQEAIASLAPALVEWTTGRCSLAANRELLLDDGCGGGRPVVGHNPLVDSDAGGADDLVTIGRISAVTDGTAEHTLATIVNYACHPTTMAWQSSEVSPDYVAAMRQVVTEATGAPVAFLQGASGELAPRQQYTGDHSVADRHGTGLGHAVLAALAALPPVGTELSLTGVVESGAPLAMWEPRPREDGTEARTLAATVDTVELELRSLPSLEELEAEWADIDPRSRAERLQRARNLRDGYVTGPTVRHPVWAWRIGGALLLAHPGEAYSDFQRAVRAQAGQTPVLVANLTNGPGFVYLPTQSAYELNAYQAWQTPLAAGSLERLVQHGCEQVTAMIDVDRVGA